MNRREERIKTLEYLYQHRLLERSFDEMYAEVGEDQLETYLPVLRRLEFVEHNEVFLIEKINRYLNNWVFERLPFVDQSILLLACSELEKGENDRVVVIDEAIELAKDFSDEEAYAYINAVLDKYEC